MAILRTGDVALYYEVHGDGPAILGIHGTPSSTLLWADAARRLSAAGRCVIYDRRGFGRSSPPGGAVHLADHVADAVAMLDHVAGVPAIVIGRSTGGLIALALALRHQDRIRALVLLEPAVFVLDEDASSWATGVRTAVLSAAPARASEAVFRAALGDAFWEGVPPEIAGHLAAASPAVVAETLGDDLDLSAHPFHPSPDDVRAIRRPTLLVSAEDSPAPLRRVNDHLAGMLPEASLVVVPGGHLIDPAGPPVLDFIRRLAPVA